MKTGFLFKSEPNITDVTVDKHQGFYFTTVTSDLRFLNNIVIDAPDYSLRLYVQQEIKGQFVGKPKLWVLLLTEHCGMNNKSYEKAWNIASDFCCTLFPYIKMGIELTHQKAWVYPNILDEWDIKRVYLDFGSVQGVGLYWDDPEGELYEEDGEIKRRGLIKNINADFVTAIGSEKILHQAHTTHLTIPSTNIQANKKNFHIENDILDVIQSGGFEYLSTDSEVHLLRLYTSAICSKNFFASFLLFYQMLEYLEKRLVEPTKLNNEILSKLKSFIKADEDLKVKSSRLMGAISNVKEETSFEMIEKGIKTLIGEEGFSELGMTNQSFKKWRHTRGDLSHVDKQVQMTCNTFIENYSSIRDACTMFINILLKQKGFDV